MIIDLFSAVLYSEKTLEMFKITWAYLIISFITFCPYNISLFGVCFWGLNVLSAACVILLTWTCCCTAFKACAPVWIFGFFHFLHYTIIMSLFSVKTDTRDTAEPFMVMFNCWSIAMVVNHCILNCDQVLNLLPPMMKSHDLHFGIPSSFLRMSVSACRDSLD